MSLIHLLIPYPLGHTEDRIAVQSAAETDGETDPVPLPHHGQLQVTQRALLGRHPEGPALAGGTGRLCKLQVRRHLHAGRAEDGR